MSIDFFIAIQRRFPTSYLLQQVQRQSIVIVRAATETSTLCSMDNRGNDKSKIEASLDIHRAVLFWLSLTASCTGRQVLFSFSRMSGIEFVSRKAEREVPHLGMCARVSVLVLWSWSWSMVCEWMECARYYRYDSVSTRVSSDCSGAISAWTSSWSLISAPNVDFSEQRVTHKTPPIKIDRYYL